MSLASVKVSPWYGNNAISALTTGLYGENKTDLCRCHNIMARTTGPFLNLFVLTGIDFPQNGHG